MLFIAKQKESFIFVLVYKCVGGSGLPDHSLEVVLRCVGGLMHLYIDWLQFDENCSCSRKTLVYGCQWQFVASSRQSIVPFVVFCHCTAVPNTRNWM